MRRSTTADRYASAHTGSIAGIALTVDSRQDGNHHYQRKHEENQSSHGDVENQEGVYVFSSLANVSELMRESEISHSYIVGHFRF